MSRPAEPARWTLLLATATALATASHLLAGQQPAGVRPAAAGTITGTVYDSTAATPLAGATVLLTHATRVDLAPVSLLADSAGRFAAPQLEPGRWFLTFFHRAADEYGVAPVPREVMLGESESRAVTLTLPGAYALRRAICGSGARSDSIGILVGSVRDAETGAALANAGVTVSWRVIDFRDGVRVSSERVPVATAADGTFRFCGVPVDDPLSVRAAGQGAGSAGSSMRSGELFVTVARSGITRVDIGVGRAMTEVSASTATAGSSSRLVGTARLAGLVAGADGRPQADARVLVHGTGQEVVTGSAGTFRFDSLPAGSWTVEARAIGATPVRQAVLLSSARMASARLVFARWSPSLDRVVVYGRMPAEQKFMDDFLERRERGLGRFFTGDEIVQARVNQVSEMLLRIPDVRVRPAFQGGRSPTLEGRGGCPAVVYVNGMRVPQGEKEIDYLVRPAEVLALEVHDDVNGVPAMFAGANNCVVVGIWTRR